MRLLKFIIIALLLVDLASAQDLAKYRRSSLHVVLVESGSYPDKEMVVNAYNSYPFPDKYNNHGLDGTYLTKNLGDTEFKKAGYLRDTLKNPFAIAKAVGSLKTLKYLDPEKKTAVVMPSSMDSVKAKIDLYISEDRLANQMVAKWFNVDQSGNFNYELIKERGKYSASSGEVDLSAKVVTGSDYLYDEELIGNTFVVFNKFKFYPNEPVAKLVLVAALAEASTIKLDFAKSKAIEAANAVYERTKEGYTVVTTSFLYKLNWDKSAMEVFKTRFVNEANAGIRRKFLDTTTSFKLNFLGEQTSIGLVTFKFGEKRTLQQVIDLSVKRNVDKVYAMLQREYEVFRPIAPVNSVNPLTARIGLKEGVEPGQKFEILESEKDKKTGLFKWKSIGTAKVDKKLPVWDNRFGAKEELPAGTTATDEFTTFSGGGKAEAGIHFLRLVK